VFTSEKKLELTFSLKQRILQCNFHICNENVWFSAHIRIKFRSQSREEISSQARNQFQNNVLTVWSTHE